MLHINVVSSLSSTVFSEVCNEFGGFPLNSIEHLPVKLVLLLLEAALHP